MRKLVFGLGFATLAAASQAALNFNIDVAYQAVTQPTSGTVSVTFSGTVDILLSGFDVTDWAIELPGNGSSFLGAAVDPGFAAYAAAVAPGVDYSGDLFTVFVSSSDATGDYFLNGSAFGFSPMAEMIVTASDVAGTLAPDNEFFGVTVNPVPEPATLAALGMGALALLRRRRK